MSEIKENIQDTKDETSKKTSKKKNSLGRELMEDVIMVLVVLVVVFLIKNFVLINAVIPSGSMENTIMTGDRVFGNRLAYRFGDPERGDIAIFRYPDDESELYIKRVMGLPGDTIEIKDGLLYLNNSEEPIAEPYLKEIPEGDFGPYQVPEGCYFMLGDNRNKSNDSRMWENTYVTRENVLAKAVFRYYPFDKIGRIE